MSRPSLSYAKCEYPPFGAIRIATPVPFPQVQSSAEINWDSITLRIQPMRW